MNRVSVFGSSGFIGRRFCEMYPDRVISVNRDDYKAPTKELLYFISTVDNYNIYDDLHVDIETNLIVLMNVLTELKQQYTVDNPPTINFISSWFVYGKNSTIPFKEESYCIPTGFYSITKKCAEDLLICFCNTFGYNYRILRLANVIGEGDLKVSKKKNALQYIIKEAVEGREISLYNGGDLLRDYIYVDDACSAIQTVLTKGELNEIYNIGSGIPYRFRDIILKAVEVANSSSKVQTIPSTNFHNIVQTKDAYLDITKLTSLGFTPEYTIDETVQKLVEYYKKIVK